MAQPSSEDVLQADIFLRIDLAYFTQQRNRFYGVELCEFAISAQKSLEFLSPVGAVITHVAEPALSRKVNTDQVAEFHVERLAEDAFAQATAHQVLFPRDALNERDRDVGSVIADPKFLHILGHASCKAQTADGYEFQLLRTNRPAHAVARQDSGQRGDRCGIVVRRNRPINEYVLLCSQHNLFGIEVHGRGGAGTHYLPKWNVQIAVGIIRVGEEGLRIVCQRPCRPGGLIANNDQQKFFETCCSQKGGNLALAILREHSLKQQSKRFGFIPGNQQLLVEVVPRHRLEHGAAIIYVEVEDLLNRHTPAKGSCDDGAGTGACEQIEVIC